MNNDRLQELLNLILFANEITRDTDNAHIEICEAFNDLEKQSHYKDMYISTIEAEIKELQKEYGNLDYKFSCVLDNATGGRASKSNIDLNIAYRLMGENTYFWVNSALEELEIPKTHTEKEVAAILVSNNNKVLKMLGDYDKFFTIEGDKVICKRKRLFGMPAKILNEYTFDYVIEEAKQ